MRKKVVWVFSIKLLQKSDMCNHVTSISLGKIQFDTSFFSFPFHTSNPSGFDWLTTWVFTQYHPPCLSIIIIMMVRRLQCVCGGERKEGKVCRTDLFWLTYPCWDRKWWTDWLVGYYDKHIQANKSWICSWYV